MRDFFRGLGFGLGAGIGGGIGYFFVKAVVETMMIYMFLS